MRSHEIDLITALAEGSLPDESEARALIESSPEARAAYEDQLLAIESLAVLAGADLTGAESAELRRDIWTGLRSPSSSQRSPWWSRVAVAGGALVVAFGLFAVLTNQLSEREAASLEGGGEVSTLDDGATAPTDGAAGVTTTAGATAEERADLQFFTMASEEIRDQSINGETFDPEEQGQKLDELSACVERAGLTDQRIIGEVDEPEAAAGDEATRSFIAVVPADMDLDEDTPVTFVDPVECVVVHTED